MGLGEAEISAQGAGVADTNVGHEALHVGEDRQATSEGSRPLDAAVCRRRADSDHPIIQLDRIQSGDHLHVNQVLVTEHIVLHRQQQFRPASIERRILAKMA